MLQNHISEQPVEISVVVPLFNEQESINELYRRLTDALERIGSSYELVLVDDGSTDFTPILLRELYQQDERVVVLTLSRNFGHQAAISAGIDHASGDAVIVMDGDLQDPPEVLDQFIDAWREGYEVVYAVRTKRKENLVKRTGYALFYRLLRRMSYLDIPLDSGDFGLMDRRVVDVIKDLPERSRFVRGLRTYAGFRQIGIQYERSARKAGKPKYTIRGLIRLALDGVYNFSHFPLTAITWLGTLVTAAAFGFAACLTFQSLSQQQLPSGWTITLAAVLFLSGLQFLSLGIIGEYLRRIFLECKGRPTYLLRHVAARQPDQQSAPVIAEQEQVA